jgi:hypothetical protein
MDLSFKILTTPYYVEHDMGFDTKPLATKPDGQRIQSRPFIGSTLIAFKALRHDGMKRLVVMNAILGLVWQFDPDYEGEHFEIKNKVPEDLMWSAIHDMAEKGDEINIQYENV